MIKEYILRNTDKRLTKVIEYNDNKFVLLDELEGADHGGTAISKITFEENQAFSDLINYLEFVLNFKEEELELLYEDFQEN